MIRSTSPAVATVTKTATGFTPTIPAHVAGQLIVVCVGTNGTTLTISSNTGVWNSEVVMNSGSGWRAGVFSCVADGTNMAITLASTSATVLNHIIYVINNADTVDVGTTSTGTTGSAVNPPSCTIAGGVNKDVLWIPFGWNGGAAWTASAAPTGFGNLQTISRSSVPRWGMATAELVETGVQTKDPAAFGTNATTTWYSQTLGIYKA